MAPNLSVVEQARSRTPARVEPRPAAGPSHGAKNQARNREISATRGE